MKIHYVLPALFALAACGSDGSGFWSKPSQTDADTVQPVPRPSSGGVEIGGAGRSAESLDQTTQAEREAAVASAQGGAFLGETIASLGDPGQPGFWLKTSLVEAETPGRIEAEGGAKLSVTLIPLSSDAGSGSEISLAAIRGLGLSLTDLPTLKVFR